MAASASRLNPAWLVHRTGAPHTAALLQARGGVLPVWISAADPQEAARQAALVQRIDALIAPSLPLVQQAEAAAVQLQQVDVTLLGAGADGFAIQQAEGWEVQWVASGQQANDHHTVVHEFGHALGLAHPREDPYLGRFTTRDSVMLYRSRGGLQPWFASADLTALQTLWGPQGADGELVQAWPDPGRPQARLRLRLGGETTADRLSGSRGRDWLTGLGGDDWISGGAGNDRLVAGSGADLLIGGSGSDSVADLRDGSVDQVWVAAGRQAKGVDRLEGLEAIDQLWIDLPKRPKQWSVLSTDHEGFRGQGVVVNNQLVAIVLGSSLSNRQLEASIGFSAAPLA